ncbi:hypothetical protein I553_0807 [Mycobacterium xenopi 4042]|uniref:Uncharacterized protein n=1 Tax=Mycobacterium xenopi 4042 TaxID=1299334 RepID=X7YKQ6_MYCXE|nr:hypothetical protein I553_0807 [Mycobacterium xenopi 4042]
MRGRHADGQRGRNGDRTGSQRAADGSPVHCEPLCPCKWSDRLSLRAFAYTLADFAHLTSTLTSATPSGPRGGLLPASSPGVMARLLRAPLRCAWSSG